MNLIKRISRYQNYITDFIKFKQLSVDRGNQRRFPLSWKDRYPCLKDKTNTTGFDHHYIYHTAWAARILAQNQPKSHVDISSSLYFSGLVSAFMPVTFYDFRPAKLFLNNLKTDTADICSLPFPDQGIQSLSCMHVVEHIGLGRYGDLLNPEGDLKAISELKRVLAKKGSLLFVTPVGKPMIMFNAHRIYSFDQIVQYFNGLNLIEFSLIPDNPEQSGLIRYATKEMADAQRYGCGCFWFRK